MAGWNRSPLPPDRAGGIPLVADLPQAAAAAVCLLVLADSEAVDAVLKQGGSLRRELTLIGAGERVVEASLVATPGGVVAVLHDVTERRRQERLRSEFLANVSHELRTPVTAIRGFAETLLEGDAGLPEQARSCNAFIGSSKPIVRAWCWSGFGRRGCRFG